MLLPDLSVPNALRFKRTQILFQGANALKEGRRVSKIYNTETKVAAEINTL